jgi:hypothetical protein
MGSVKPEGLNPSTAHPRGGGDPGVFRTAVHSATLERMNHEKHEHTRTGRSKALPELERSCSFVFFVVEKTWVPAFAGMSGWG